MNLTDNFFHVCKLNVPVAQEPYLCYQNFPSNYHKFHARRITEKDKLTLFLSSLLKG